MWTARSRPTQIPTYYIGYRQVTDLYNDVKQARGAQFKLKDFMDGMLAPGPVPVSRCRAILLPKK
jgi:uncharacterized protein (DUF885 family)